MNAQSWTAAEVAFLKEYAPGHTQREIHAEHNQRFPDRQRTLSCIKSGMKRYGVKNGNDSRFKPGHVSTHTTKGKKLSPEHKAKLQRTMFSKDNRPPKYHPVGTEMKRPDGYIWVKVADEPDLKKDANWKKKQQLVWEQHNGPIPDGMFVTFLDGNHENFDLDNLALITRAEHARLNKSGLRSEDPEITASALQLAKLTTKIGQLQRDIKHKNDEEGRDPGKEE